MTKQEYEARSNQYDECMQLPLALEYIASLEAENAALTLLHTQATDQMIKMQNRAHELEAENANLRADNRSLVEQMNQMALKPNQAIIERHEYNCDSPETYPTKKRSYLCETIAGFIELCWNPIGQEWHLVSEANIIYNHFQINAYYMWVYPPQRNDK